MLPRGSSVEELVQLVNKADLDPIKEINEAVSGNKTVQEQHLSSVELMVLLNEYMQDVTNALEESLKQLESSGKRIPHEIDLLKNDVRTFDDQQMETLPEITRLANANRRSAVLNELSSYSEVRNRIMSVYKLLEASQSPEALSEETRKQLATVFAGTPDEAKWSSTSTKNYYELFNKIIN